MKDETVRKIIQKVVAARVMRVSGPVWVERIEEPDIRMDNYFGIKYWTEEDKKDYPEERQQAGYNFFFRILTEIGMTVHEDQWAGGDGYIYFSAPRTIVEFVGALYEAHCEFQKEMEQAFKEG